MKAIAMLMVVAASLMVADAAAQQSSRATRVQAQEATPAMKVRPLKDMVRDVDAKNVGICLRGKKARLIEKRGDAKNCDSLFWVQAQSWAAVQHELNTGGPDRLSAGSGNTRGKCSSCSGLCQTITISGSGYDGVDVGGGQSPSQCIDAVEKACAGASSSMASAHCGN